MPKRPRIKVHEEEALRFAIDLMHQATARRIRRGWSQSMFAEKMGVTQACISYMERHPERVRLDRLYVLLRLMDMELKVTHESAEIRRPAGTQED